MQITATCRIAINSLVKFSQGSLLGRFGPGEFCLRPLEPCSLSCFRYESRTFLRSLTAISVAAKNLHQPVRKSLRLADVSLLLRKPNKSAANCQPEQCLTRFPSPQARPFIEGSLSGRRYKCRTVRQTDHSRLPRLCRPGYYADSLQGIRAIPDSYRSVLSSREPGDRPVW